MVIWVGPSDLQLAYQTASKPADLNMSAHRCEANALKSELLWEPFMTLSTARTWSSSVAARAGPVLAATNAASTPPATTSPLRALVRIASASPTTAAATARRAAEDLTNVRLPRPRRHRRHRLA